MRRLAVFLGAALSLSAVPLGAWAGDPLGGVAILRSDQSGFVEERRIPHDARGIGGMAVRDLGNDGIAEFAVGSGIGAAPTVRALRYDGSQIFVVPAFDESYRGDVHVAAGDLDGDNDAEIVAATGPGVSGRIRVFDGGLAQGEGFLPYGPAFRGGIAVAIGDWNGDGREDIATAPSSAGGPHIRLWDRDGKLLGEFSAFDPGMIGDFDIAAGDLDADGKDELVILRPDAVLPIVRVLSPERGQVLHEFQAGPKGEAATVAIGDIDADGIPEILLTGGMPVVTHVVSGSGEAKREIPFTGEAVRVRIGVASFGAGPRFVAAALEAGDAKNASAKYVEVDVSEQRLRAYEYGRLVRSFLVTTGDLGHPTPLGDFSFIEKPYKVNYKWSYGPGNPNNYDLGWVTWNLRFAPHIYVHYAPWRAKFGVRGSHGCVNVSKADAQWIYEWAQVGTPITVQE